MTQVEIEAELTSLRQQLSQLRQQQESRMKDRRRLAIFILGMAIVFAVTGGIFAWFNSPATSQLILMSITLTPVGWRLLKFSVATPD
jgi:hypothetical protein